MKVCRSWKNRAKWCKCLSVSRVVKQKCAPPTLQACRIPFLLLRKQSLSCRINPEVLVFKSFKTSQIFQPRTTIPTSAITEETNNQAKPVNHKRQCHCLHQFVQTCYHSVIRNSVLTSAVCLCRSKSCYSTWTVTRRKSLHLLPRLEAKCVVLADYLS